MAARASVPVWLRKCSSSITPFPGARIGHVRANCLFAMGVCYLKILRLSISK
nr:MAG TPA: hypothetical protein [Caudoviricetes sp.]